MVLQHLFKVRRDAVDHLELRGILPLPDPALDCPGEVGRQLEKLVGSSESEGGIAEYMQKVFAAGAPPQESSSDEDDEGGDMESENLGGRGEENEKVKTENQTENKSKEGSWSLW